MNFSLVVSNILLIVIGVIFLLLSIPYKIMIFPFFIVLCLYYILLLYLTTRLRSIFSFMKNNEISKIINTELYFFKEFNIFIKLLKTLISKDKMLEAVNLSLSQSSTASQFYKVIVENLGLIFTTPNVCFLLYNPSSEKIEFKYGNGILDNIKVTPNFIWLNSKISDTITKQEFSKFIRTDISNLNNLAFLKFESSIGYIGYLMFGYEKKDVPNTFYKDFKMLFLEIQTSFALHINNNILNKRNYDLNLLNKIITLMEENKNIDELLHLFLTHLTAKEGLGFNRAILFKQQEDSDFLVGIKSIGPLTKEEAETTWEMLNDCPIDLLLKMPPEENNSPLANAVLESKLYLNNDKLISSIVKSKNYQILEIDNHNFSSYNLQVLENFNLKKFLMVPLVSYDNFIGLLILDNSFDQKAYSNIRIDSLLAFANQTSLVIHNLFLYNKIKQMAIIDELTKLYNRRFFEEKLEEEMNRATRYNFKCSLIMIDIDHFKNYNDKNGHIAGDNLLNLISSIFESSCRKSDFVCRYGGEEFSIILPDTDSKGALEVAEKIRKRVYNNSFMFETKQPNRKLTISLGVASYPNNVNNKLELKALADKALYLSKEKGRNRVSSVEDLKDISIDPKILDII